MLVMGLSAQAPEHSTGSIRGLIQDPVGAAIPAIRVQLRSEATGEEWGTVTDTEGRYFFPNLAPGAYYMLIEPEHGFAGGETSVLVVAGKTAEYSTTLPIKITLAKSGCSPPDAPNPKALPADLSGARVSLVRTTCLGACPDYSIEIDSDGTVLFTGRFFVQQKGTARASIGSAAFRQLVNDIYRNGWTTVCSKYTSHLTDEPSTIVSLRIGGAERTVEVDGGSGPDGFYRLADEIDRIVDSHRWRHGHPATESLAGPHVLTESDEYLPVAVVSEDSFGPKPGLTPLMSAAGQAKLQALKSLLASVTDVDEQDASGWTALMYAATAGDVQGVQALLEHKANPTVRSRVGETALMAAALDASPEKTKALLAAGADVNAQSEAGETALMWAAWHCNADVARILLGSGANVNLRSLRGDTAMSRLLGGEGDRWEETMRALHEAGAVP